MTEAPSSEPRGGDPGGGDQGVGVVRVLAPAKINFALEVVGKRPDGYHELATIFQTISFGDEIEVELAAAGRGIELEVGFEGFEGTGRSQDLTGPSASERDPVGSPPDLGPADANLVVRAADLLLRAAGRANDRRVRLHLTKRIPVGAGLGGGSSDAAATLIALNHLLGSEGVSDHVLHEIAVTLGADVPFFLVGGTCLGTGIGDVLRPLPACPDVSLVVVFPNVAVATSSVFGRLESGLTPPGPLARMSPLDIRPDFWDRDWTDFRNDLEPLVAVDGSVVAELLRTFRRLGSGFSRMSGSGSAVFGVAPDEGRAREWTGRFRAEGFWARAVRPTRAGCRLLESGAG